MFYILFAINIFVFFACIFAANNQKFLFLKYSLVNPVFFVALFLALFSLDFMLIYNDGYTDVYEEFLPINNYGIIKAYLFFTLCHISLVLGFFAALKNKTSKKIKFIHISRKVSNIGFLIIMLLVLVGSYKLFLDLNNILSGNVTRQNYFIENKIVYIAFSLVAPAFVIFISNQSRQFLVFLVFLFVCLILAVTGSRGSVILLALIYGYYINSTVTKVSLKNILWVLPLIVSGLLVSRYYLRESWRYNSIFEFLDDKEGVFAVFFRTAEISMADVLVVLCNYSHHISRYPFESFLSAIMYPLPRALFEWKPISADGVVTSEFSPLRWELTKSEIVITGFGDFFIQFGWLFSIFLCFVIGYIWLKIILSSIYSLGNKSILIVPFMMWWMYIFLRSGVFNMAGSVWSYLLILIIFGFSTKLFGSSK